MNPALLQKGSNSFRTDSEIKDHEGRDDDGPFLVVLDPQLKKKSCQSWTPSDKTFLIRT